MTRWGDRTHLPAVTISESRAVLSLPNIIVSWFYNQITDWWQIKSQYNKASFRVLSKAGSRQNFYRQKPVSEILISLVIQPCPSSTEAPCASSKPSELFWHPGTWTEDTPCSMQSRPILLRAQNSLYPRLKTPPVWSVQATLPWECGWWVSHQVSLIDVTTVSWALVGHFLCARCNAMA